MEKENNQPTSSTNGIDIDRIDDVEIAPRETYVDLTDAEQQVLVVVAVGDMDELAPDAPIPDEDEARVDHDPEAVIARTDEPGKGSGLVAMDAPTFRRRVYRGAFYRLERPKAAWALVWEAYRDELREEFGEDGETA